MSLDWAMALILTGSEQVRRGSSELIRGLPRQGPNDEGDQDQSQDCGVELGWLALRGRREAR
eukprot:1235439-Pyramimonas_sp.AAC.1